MTKEQLKKWLPEITHWVNGGDLYIYNPIDDTWNLKINKIFRVDQIYVIEDKHFEARKAFALDEDIESRYIGEDDWTLQLYPVWDLCTEYRPKPKEPVYEYQWYDIPHLDEVYELSKEHWIEAEVSNASWIKFEPSKRIRL